MYQKSDSERQWQRQQSEALGGVDDPRIAKLLAAWRDSPTLFARQAFGVQLWSFQHAVCKSVLDNELVAVRAGHKVGKTLSVAILAVWWWFCWQGRVFLNAPTSSQIRQYVWAEIIKLHNAAKVHLEPIGGLGGRMNQLPELGLQLKTRPDQSIVGRSSKRGDQIQGASGSRLLVLVDEASGLTAEIHAALRSMIMGAEMGRMALFGNPLDNTGPHGQAFLGQAKETDDSSRYRCFTVSSESTPNFRADRIVVPGLATRKGVQLWRDECTKLGQPDSFYEDPRYRVRVLGEHATGGDRRVIDWATAKQASKRSVEPSGTLVLGVDVARYGDDDSVIAPRRGRRGYKLRVIHGHDTTAVANEALATAKEMRGPNEPVTINVDGIGLGAGVVDELRRLKNSEDLKWLAIRDVNVAKKPTSEKALTLYANYRAQVWFAAGDAMKAGAAIPDDPQLVEELNAPDYLFDASSGKMKVEANDDVKARLGRSPDRATAVVLSFIAPAIVDTTPLYKGIPKMHQPRGFG